MAHRMGERVKAAVRAARGSAYREGSMLGVVQITVAESEEDKFNAP